MAETLKRLAHGSVSASTPAAAYTAPASTSTYIRKIVVSNNSGASGTIRIYHLDSGGTIADADTILPETTLGDKEHGESDGFYLLATGDSIQMAGDGMNAISYSIYGAEVTP